MSIHFVRMIKIVHLIMFMRYLFGFSDMRVYSGKSFFVTLLQSQISEKPKGFCKESSYGLVDYCKGNFLYF